MSTEGQERESGAAVTVGDEPDAGSKRKLEMQVDIRDVGPCKKHVKVSIPRSEIERQYTESLEDFGKDVAVPGFRPGRAPRQLVIKRFKKQVSEQVKSSLLMASLEQLDEDYELDPIAQPKLDVAAIELPEDGPMNFEIDVEVRPQFTLPEYHGLTLKRPVRPISEADIQTHLQRYLERYGQVVPKLEGAAELGDYLTADLVFHRPDGSLLNEAATGRSPSWARRWSGPSRARRAGPRPSWAPPRASPPCGARPWRWTSGCTTSSRCDSRR
jgi:trigger factor